MGDAEGSESIKLVATCIKCGARLEPAHEDSPANPRSSNQSSSNQLPESKRGSSKQLSNLCAQCRSDALDDNEEADSDRDDGNLNDSSVTERNLKDNNLNANNLNDSNLSDSNLTDSKNASNLNDNEPDDDADIKNERTPASAVDAKRAGASSFPGSQSSESRSDSAPESGSESTSPSQVEAKPLHDPDVPVEYEIIAKFADCKNGRAYRVRDKSLGKELIIRFFTAGVARSTGGLPIESVARLLVAQNHPNLQTVYDWLPERGTNCLILDTVPEITVESVIKNEGFFDLGRAIDIFIEVCEGIEELHKQGMIHGFIRPRTIGISVSDTGVDTAKVTNFSITNAYSNVLDQPLKIGRNYTCHDSFYMSPEEIDGKVVDQASDVYSLGCVLFHAITGKPVYRGKEVRDVLEQHLGSAPARFRKRYEIPENVESVVLHMLEKEPLARYKSIRSVRVDLQRIRDKKQPIIENIWRKFFGMLGGR